MPPGLKIALFVLLILAALLIIAVSLLLFVRVRIRIGLRDKLFFKLYIGSVRLLSLPRPPKKLRKLSSYTKKKAMRAAAKQAKHPEDYMEDLRRHPIYREIMKRYADHKKKKPQAEPQKQDKPKASAPKKSLDAEVLMTMIAELLQAILKGTHKGVHVHLCRLHVNVAGQDAAQTALITGSLWAALANLLSVLDRLTRLRIKHADVSITPDYTGDKTRTEFDLVMSCNLYRALGIVLPLIPIIRTHKDSLIKKSAKASTAS
jgi:hypothetical protein